LNLKVGDRAPVFAGTDEGGREVSLADFKGKWVALFFYPKDMTLNCTIEACNLRDRHYDLLNKGVQVIGVSADTEKSHEEFKTKYNLPYPLIADTTKAIVNAYGVWGTKRFLIFPFDGIRRTTFVINPEGKIEAIINKVNSNNHADQILKLITK